MYNLGVGLVGRRGCWRPSPVFSKGVEIILRWHEGTGLSYLRMLSIDLYVQRW